MFSLIDILLIIAAVLPAALLMIFIYKKDKVEKEPFGMLLKMALLGIVATMAAGRLNYMGLVICSFLPDSWYNFAFYFLIVGPVEEGIKYLALRIHTWKNRNFNYTFDAVVYSAFVSLGFALWENIDYVLDYGFETALLRAVTSIPGHLSFSVFMGLLYGTAKRHQLWGDDHNSRKYSWLAWIIPALIHGTYDYVATTNFTAGSIVFIVFIAALFVSAYIGIKRASRDDQPLE